MSNTSNIGAGKSVSSSSYSYFAEWANGEISDNFSTIEQVVADLRDIKVLTDWQRGYRHDGKTAESATITFHDRPCGIMVRVPVQSSVTQTRSPQGPIESTVNSGQLEFVGRQVYEKRTLPHTSSDVLKLTVKVASFTGIDAAKDAERFGQLFASAPELLSTLKELVEWSERAGCSDAFLADARAAVSKAEGARK